MTDVKQPDDTFLTRSLLRIGFLISFVGLSSPVVWIGAFLLFYGPVAFEGQLFLALTTLVFSTATLVAGYFVLQYKKWAWIYLQLWTLFWIGTAIFISLTQGMDQVLVQFKPQGAWHMRWGIIYGVPYWLIILNLPFVRRNFFRKN